MNDKGKHRITFIESILKLKNSLRITSSILLWWKAMGKVIHEHYFTVMLLWCTGKCRVNSSQWIMPCLHVGWRDKGGTIECLCSISTCSWTGWTWTAVIAVLLVVCSTTLGAGSLTMAWSTAATTVATAAVFSLSFLTYISHIKRHFFMFCIQKKHKNQVQDRMLQRSI